MSIFKTPAPSKATREGQAVGALTGDNKIGVPTPDRGVSVKNLPNARPGS